MTPQQLWLGTQCPNFKILALSLASAEVISPGAHLEAGRHLAHPPLQDLHLAMGLCVGEQRGLSYFAFAHIIITCSYTPVCVCLPTEEAPADGRLARDA